MSLETYGEALSRIANANSCSNEDEAIVENALRKLGFADARVVLGCVYPFGQGRPMSVQQAAKDIHDAMVKEVA